MMRGIGRKIADHPNLEEAFALSVVRASPIRFAATAPPRALAVRSCRTLRHARARL